MGRVFNIQRFSLHDGPGIRTTCFLMGCSLRCRWCHNPEGFSENIRLQYTEKDCICCGACCEVCPKSVHVIEGNQHRVDFDACIFCRECITVCPTQALQPNGREYSVEELTAQILRDLLCYREKGGVTFSGGEPLLQAEFVAETARRCKEEGVPTIAIDTAGNVPWEAFEMVLPVVDYFLYDIKAATEELHIQGTGCSNCQILHNLERLGATGKPLYIRIPVIAGYNDSLTEMKKIARIIKDIPNVAEVRLLPYHTFGREKYTTLGYETPECFSEPEEQRMRELQKIIEERYEE